MTPLEVELLKTIWPYVWTGILGAAAWLMKSQNARLASIDDALHSFGGELSRVEKQMLEDRSVARQRIDRLIGEIDARVVRLEAVSEMQHESSVGRRRANDKPLSWEHESDVLGKSTR